MWPSAISSQTKISAPPPNRTVTQGIKLPMLAEGIGKSCTACVLNDRKRIQAKPRLRFIMLHTCSSHLGPPRENLQTASLGQPCTTTPFRLLRGQQIFIGLGGESCVWATVCAGWNVFDVAGPFSKIRKGPKNVERRSSVETSSYEGYRGPESVQPFHFAFTAAKKCLVHQNGDAAHGLQLSVRRINADFTSLMRTKTPPE